MPANRGCVRSVSRAIHWLLIFGSLVLLGSGWVIGQTGPDAPDRSFWVETHVSLGLSCAILLFLQAVLWTIRGPGAARDTGPRWRTRLTETAKILFYLSLAVAMVSGYAETTLGGRSVSYWGIALPQWDVSSIVSASRLGEIHRVLAYGVGGLIFLHLAMSSLNLFRHGPIPDAGPTPLASRVVSSLPAESREARPLLPTPMQNHDLDVARTAQSLAWNLRLFGWIDFWVQFVLGLIIALLLVFASSGKAFSPSRPGFGDAIYWGYAGFVLLLPAVLLAFTYVRASKKVAHLPIDYLHHEKRIAFWFLWTGLLIGGLGIFVSFIGVAMSIALLVVKTISQPPGIAITDPNNIIRALDVFVLIVNFMLLIAHFVGVGIALWLGFAAAKARVGYMALTSRAA